MGQRFGRETVWSRMGAKVELPEIAGTKSGVLVVIGSARCVHDDLEKFNGMFPAGDHDTMVCNHVGAYYPKFEHWASPYPDDGKVWEDYRETLALPQVDFLGHTWGGRAKGKFMEWPINVTWVRSAGQLAVTVGVALGYDLVVMAGVPCDDGGHFYPTSENHIYKDYAASFHTSTWMQLKSEFFENKVRSLSGYTRDWFGEP